MLAAHEAPQEPTDGAAAGYVINPTAVIPPMKMEISPIDFVPFVLIPFIWWGVRRMKLKQGDFARLKQATLKIGIAAYFVTEIARSFYRPYIYAHELNDFHIADTIGNSAGTVTAIFMILTLTRSEQAKDTHLFLIVFLGLIAYELVSGVGDHPIDVLDLIATVLFTTVSAIFYYGYLKPKLGVANEGKVTAE
jgi:hypothetical protein